MKIDLTCLLPAILVTALPSAALAQNGIETLIGHLEPQANGGAIIDIRLLNTGTSMIQADVAEMVGGQIDRPGALGAGRTVMLHRDPATPATFSIAPGTFATARYKLGSVAFQDGALLSIPSWSGQVVKLAIPSASVHAAPAASDSDTQVAAAPASTPTSATPSPSDRTVGNAFLENLSAYQPIYAVYGPGTNSEARIQLSFKYQLFGSEARENRPALGDGFYFAYTQRMFWDLGADSSPFRNIDFQPELFYTTPPKALSDKVTLSAQIGLRHESNGRDGDVSRSLNTVYVAPMAAFSLGNETRLTVAPRAWLYAGDLSDNSDIRRYRGNSGLTVEVGQDDGLRLSTSSRINFGSGKGSISADLSYPLRRILGGGPDFYLFGQSFVGYGENLLDYNRRTNRLRIGVALVR
eukprot:TRINITY_DN4187_c0_g1_i2.p1 TRINITY_DN4187_c0_g1~~TRINITY_DN4187_c0_g1_i2.p1  ORF type:complete len:410 (-),score=71.08 TRINITY_DN4187_c0_g1_i2:313-1542(-)